MNIRIGPYRSDIIPVNYWALLYENRLERTVGEARAIKRDYRSFDKFVLRVLDKLATVVGPLNRWSNTRKRKIKVHIDHYDVWSADHTLALIIHPVLVKLKETQRGFSFVDDEDVPEELRFKDKEILDWCDGDDEVKAKHIDIARWEWILDEMIWAFSQHSRDSDTDEFYHNCDQLEISTKEIPGSDPGMTFWRDDEGLKKHAERKANGRRLFGKYYEHLWD